MSSSSARLIVARASASSHSDNDMAPLLLIATLCIVAAAHIRPPLPALRPARCRHRPTGRRCCAPAWGPYRVFGPVVRTSALLAGQRGRRHRASGDGQCRVFEAGKSRDGATGAADSAPVNRCRPSASRITEASRLIARCSSLRTSTAWPVGSSAVACTRPTRAACAAATVPPGLRRPGLQQAVRCESVGAMHPGPSDLPGGVQAGQSVCPATGRVSTPPQL